MTGFPSVEMKCSARVVLPGVDRNNCLYFSKTLVKFKSWHVGMSYASLAWKRGTAHVSMTSSDSFIDVTAQTFFGIVSRCI